MPLLSEACRAWNGNSCIGLALAASCCFARNSYAYARCRGVAPRATTTSTRNYVTAKWRTNACSSSRAAAQSDSQTAEKCAWRTPYFVVPLYSPSAFSATRIARILHRADDWMRQRTFINAMGYFIHAIDRPAPTWNTP